jgi:hypothetical protein
MENLGKVLNGLYSKFSVVKPEHKYELKRIKTEALQHVIMTERTNQEEISDRNIFLTADMIARAESKVNEIGTMEGKLIFTNIINDIISKDGNIVIEQLNIDSKNSLSALTDMNLGNIIFPFNNFLVNTKSDFLFTFIDLGYADHSSSDSRRDLLITIFDKVQQKINCTTVLADNHQKEPITIGIVIQKILSQMEIAKLGKISVSSVEFRHIILAVFETIVYAGLYSENAQYITTEKVQIGKFTSKALRKSMKEHIIVKLYGHEQNRVRLIKAVKNTRDKSDKKWMVKAHVRKQPIGKRGEGNYKEIVIKPHWCNVNGTIVDDKTYKTEKEVK